MGNNDDRPTGLLSATELTVERRDTFAEILTIKDQAGIQLGSTRRAGTKLLRIVSEWTDFFPHRPIEVTDANGQPMLWIEQRGLLRRHIITVCRPDRTRIGKLVGKSWPGLRYTGYWVEIDGERIGEVLVEKHGEGSGERLVERNGYRIADTSGVELARIVTSKGEQRTRAVPHTTPRRTTLQASQQLSEPFARFALTVAIARHAD
ncbi:MAG: hypothetical protein GX610_23865 [Rhodococcus sp.]|nr:hypothetical protein [Rhodococcus sp. (in: high G+C Gram-positive bacteria)]